jgi:hypothetical protein
MLMYGYNLGSDEHGWNVQQVDEYGSLAVNWPGLDDSDFKMAADAVLLASVGFTETDWQADGFFDRQHAAEARLGVEIESHCSNEYPAWVLAAKVITARRGDADVIDFAALTAQAVAEDWDGKLAAALVALGLTPTQERPQWLLASYWG